MADSFHKHPAFAVLLRDSTSLRLELTAQQCAERVRNLVDDLVRAGVLSAPKGLSDVTRRFGQRSRERAFFRFFAALGCLRASLGTLDQMIYQAITHDKLLVLNEQNMIKLSARVSHLSGNGLRIMYQPGQQRLPEPPDIVLVKCSSLKPPVDAVCRIEGITVDDSVDLGETAQLDLREVDANLSPFGGLIDYL